MKSIKYKHFLTVITTVIFSIGFIGCSGDDNVTYLNTEDPVSGIYFVNEGWFGHEKGSINILTKQGSLIYNAYQKANPGEELGVTTQYGTIYGDNFYILSKQGKRIVVADAKTLRFKAGIDNIGADVRAFLGVDEKTAYISTADGIVLFNIQGFAKGNKIVGTSGQVGTMVRVEDYVFAVKASEIIIIDAITHTVKETISGKGLSSIVQSKDGSVWVGGTSKLIKINPYTLEREEIALTNQAVNTAWGAWNAGSFSASIRHNVLYWAKSNSWGVGTDIIRYDIDNNTFNNTFYTLPKTDDGSTNQVFYGAGLRVDPATDNLVITSRKNGYGESYKQNWIHIVNGTTGELITTKQVKNDAGEDHYWFPALPVFEDNKAPEISGRLSIIAVSKNARRAIYLRDIVTDADNLDAAIIKKANTTYNDMLDVSVKSDSLIIVTKGIAGKAVINLSCNSNGKVVTKNIPTVIQ